MEYLFYIGSITSIVKKVSTIDMDILYINTTKTIQNIKSPICVIRSSNKPPDIKTFETIIDMITVGSTSDVSLAINWLNEGEGLFEK